MISLFMSNHNIIYALFSILIALTASIVCIDIVLNLIPKLPKRAGTLWTIIAAVTISLGIKTAYIIGFTGLLDSDSLPFHIHGLVVSFVIILITSFLGLNLLLNRNISYFESGIFITLGSCATYFILIITNKMLTLSLNNLWVILGVLACLIFNIVGSFLVKRELEMRSSSKKSWIGVMFGLSIISLLLLSLIGLYQVSPHEIHFHRGTRFAPFLLLNVFMFMLIAFVGNWYQKKLQAEQSKLKNQEHYYRSLYELNPNAIIILDVNGIIINLNQSVERLALMKEADIIGTHYKNFVPDHALSFLNQQLERAFLGEVVEFETQIYNSAGEVIDVEIRNIPIALENGIQGIYCVIKDVTNEKRYMEKIQFMAYHAPLTNLPNKRKLYDDVIENVKKQIPFSLVYLDLNEFKKTNDLYGHLAGDAVLIEVANRLKESDNDGVAYHIGGDEFAVTLPVVTHEPILKIVQRIAYEVRRPINYHEFTLKVYASFGIARFPYDTNSIEELLQKADLAMYASKEQEGLDFVFYNETLLKKVEERFQLEQDLKKALENQEFEVYYQPQIEISTGKLHGAEALLRWNHPEKGMISPAFFIQTLEETGLIVDVSEWVIAQALESICTWVRAGYDFQHISVNVSAKHLEKQNLYHTIRDATNGDDTLLSRLDIEITESALLNIEKSIETVQQLKKLGINISLDDFGTGYSSLSVLHQLPIDCLKIDRSFILNLTEESKVLIRLIIQMSNYLNVKVVAEGIETKEQLAFLQAEGCAYGQGFYFSKPIPKAEFEEKWLKK